jgi:hypothetical protein
VDVDKFPSFFFRCIPPALGGVPAAVILPFRHPPQVQPVLPILRIIWGVLWASLAMPEFVNV